MPCSHMGSRDFFSSTTSNLPITVPQQHPPAPILTRACKARTPFCGSLLRSGLIWKLRISPDVPRDC